MDLDFDRLARLANINLTSEERTMLQKQLPDIVEYVSKLQDVDVSKVDATYLTNAINVLRPDVVTSTKLERDAVVAAFPKSAGDALEVPGIFAS
jgi:aspartyl-tRNA(Asn)/glutamyl-tRNA(Gln) amidotransferase subunit C